MLAPFHFTNVPWKFAASTRAPPGQHPGSITIPLPRHQESTALLLDVSRPSSCPSRIRAFVICVCRPQNRRTNRIKVGFTTGDAALRSGGNIGKPGSGGGQQRGLPPSLPFSGYPLHRAFPQSVPLFLSPLPRSSPSDQCPHECCQ